MHAEAPASGKRRPIQQKEKVKAFSGVSLDGLD
jgi:hypothetical protein